MTDDGGHGLTGHGWPTFYRTDFACPGPQAILNSSSSDGTLLRTSERERKTVTRWAAGDYGVHDLYGGCRSNDIPALLDYRTPSATSPASPCDLL
jgi:hypothetical protein